MKAASLINRHNVETLCQMFQQKFELLSMNGLQCLTLSTCNCYRTAVAIHANPMECTE